MRHPPKPTRQNSLDRRASLAKRSCLIVGVGASAGGLEAFTALLKSLPIDTGFGFVLVQHLDPLHASSLAEILGRATAMKVVEAVNNQRVSPNQVYVIPPNKSLTIAKGLLRLSPREQHVAELRAIDTFLESLARDRRQHSIGVILSGCASDGTLGLEAIRAAGGLTFAQDHSAKYDSMPRHAISAECVDFVLSPEGIGKELARIAKHPFLAKISAASIVSSKKKNHSQKTAPGPLPSEGSGQPAPALPRLTKRAPKKEEEKSGYQKIVRLLQQHSRVDFAFYKPATLQRRMMRRTLMNRQASLESYADFLEKNPKELAALYSDVLINVTSFFRNPEAFEVLTNKVFPRMLELGGNEPFRVWVPGCSTGEEAYAIAMSFAAAVGRTHRSRKLQIFATDLNEANLEKARRGFYATALVQDVTPDNLQKSFSQEEGGYRITKAMRELVVFARHDLTNDPPFSKMDLISCRNLMIYLEPSLQKKVLATLHYALKPGGILFLGATESLGSLASRFIPVDSKQRFFSKNVDLVKATRPAAEAKKNDSTGAGPKIVRLPFYAAKLNGALDGQRIEVEAEREADRVSLNRFAPPGVLINGDLQIVKFRGATGAFLEPPSGKASFDLLTMAREGLELPLRAAIGRAKKHTKAVRVEGVPFVRDGERHQVNIEVLPLKNLKKGYCLVFFEDSPIARRAAANLSAPLLLADDRKGQSVRLAGLERDLTDTRNYLQSVRDHQETANEELQAANEEGQSANEELQSLNEELETSKEELESTNEELITVNEEMANRNTELDRLNNDLTNLQASTNLIVVLFGPNLTVRRFSVQAQKTFNLVASDIGKPIGAIRHNLNIPDLEVFVKAAISGERRKEHQVQDKKGRWYSVRVTPYLTSAKKADGAVLLLVDVDDLKKAERLVTEAQAQLSRHASGLEILVGERTSELITSNGKLESLVASSNLGKDEYRTLFTESQEMQKKLRRLTHQIITLQEEERKQISRELHDEVVQALIAVSVQLSSLDLLASVGAPALKEKIAHIHRLVENSVHAVHRFARGLRPAVLDDLGLIPAIHAYCRTVAEEKNLKIEIRAFGGVETLGDAERTVLFRVAQEALTNVVRHADATRVKLSIAQINGAIRMEVSDNGKSFVVDHASGQKSSKRLGLVGMKERLEMVGGSLVIGSSKGTGTTVQANIPFTPKKKTKNALAKVAARV